MRSSVGDNKDTGDEPRANFLSKFLYIVRDVRDNYILLPAASHRPLGCTQFDNVTFRKDLKNKLKSLKVAK